MRHRFIPVLLTVLLLINGLRASYAAENDRPRHHEQIVDGEGPVTYAIHVGGKMDSFNTLSYGDVYQPRFQPNASLTITNIGDEPILNPRLAINGGGDWFDMDALIAAAIGPTKGRSDEEIEYALWDFCRRYIDAGPTYDVYIWGDTRSMVRYMNCFASGACGSFHMAMPLIGHAAGLDTAGGCLADCSHAIQTVRYGGKERFFDALLGHGGRGQPRGYVPLQLDNRTVAAIEDAMADHYLIERCGTTPGFYMNVSYFGPGQKTYPIKDKDLRTERTMGMTLRPGESIRRTWTPVSIGWLSDAPSPASSGEGEITFTPRMLESAVRQEAVRAEHLSFDNGVIRVQGDQPGVLVYELYSPYVIIGAAFEAEMVLPRSGFEEARASVSAPDAEPIEQWRAKQAGATTAAWSNNKAAIFHHPTLTHRARFHLTLPAGTELKSLTLRAVFQSYVPSLPTLRLGDNEIVYRDSSPGRRRVKIEHAWKESSGHRAPPPPKAAIEPADDGEAGFRPVFRWRRPDAEKVEAYEIFVSPREDLAWPVLAPYHCVLEGDEARFRPVVDDALNDGQRYWWHVRARGVGGVWSEWSPTWSFVARGPGRPRSLRVVQDGDRERLVWEAPAAGQRVAEYEVYADTDCAVSPRREARPAQVGKKTFELPATYVGSASTCAFDITGRPEAFYRVVAVDGDGSRSVPTPIVAAHRPLWLPCEPPKVEPGKAFSFTPPLRHSTGRRVLSLHEGLVREKVDKVKYRKLDGPDWVAVDPKSGRISGDAPSELRDPPNVTIEATIADVGKARQTLAFDIPD